MLVFDRAADGALTAAGSASTGGVGTGVTDAALSVDSHCLYVRNGDQNPINVFRVGDDGSLTGQAGIGGLPAGAAGIAAR
jgi:hypothetical protein